jgi:hypothetical protein
MIIFKKITDMTLNKLINIGLVISVFALVLNIILVLLDFKSIEKFPIALATTTALLFLMKVRQAKSAKQTPSV